MAAAGDFHGGLAAGLAAESGVGPGMRAGPDPAAIIAVAQRLAGISQEMTALRLQLGRVALLDWKSPAAAAFREELSARDAAMMAVVRAIDSAANAVGAYGFSLGNSPELSLRPDLQGQPAPWFGGGFGHDLDPPFSGAGAGGAGSVGLGPQYGPGIAGVGSVSGPSIGG